ncbi:MAG: tyrosine-type recombinase/integrase [Deltaproteobacteria bacterium]|nr:tyrosine-type recombinase/integrase [Candidatus Tharpella aukensis]
MSKGKNKNHPTKGSFISVEPVKQICDIKKIKKLLSDNSRDLCLFTLGINTNLRASDILNIKIEQVDGLKAGQELVLKEIKTGKSRRITLNKAVVKAVGGLLESKQAKGYKQNDYLFTGQRGPLTVPSLSRLVKTWCAEINLKGNFASHSLRKTFGYHQRVSFGVGLPELMVTFNHSNQRQTLDYLCIQPEEVRDIYLNEI